MTNSTDFFIEFDATSGRSKAEAIDLHYPQGRRPELRTFKDQEERLPPGRSLLLIGGLSLLSWLVLISVVMALWHSAAP